MGRVSTVPEQARWATARYEGATWASTGAIPGVGVAVAPGMMSYCRLAGTDSSKENQGESGQRLQEPVPKSPCVKQSGHGKGPRKGKPRAKAKGVAGLAGRVMRRFRSILEMGIEKGVVNRAFEARAGPPRKVRQGPYCKQGPGAPWRVPPFCEALWRSRFLSRLFSPLGVCMALGESKYLSRRHTCRQTDR